MSLPRGIGSLSSEGGFILMADGVVRRISKEIDPDVVENLARMADGNAIPDF